MRSCLATDPYWLWCSKIYPTNSICGEKTRWIWSQNSLPRDKLHVHLSVGCLCAQKLWEAPRCRSPELFSWQQLFYSRTVQNSGRRSLHTITAQQALVFPRSLLQNQKLSTNPRPVTQHWLDYVTRSWCSRHFQSPFNSLDKLQNVTTLFLFRYESTSSEESSGEEKPKAEVEEENSSEPEETEKKTESQPVEEPVEEAEVQQKDADVPAAEGGAAGAEQQSERGLMDPEVSSELLEDQAEGWGRRWTIVWRHYFFMTEDVCNRVWACDKCMRWAAFHFLILESYNNVVRFKENFLKA